MSEKSGELRILGSKKAVLIAGSSVQQPSMLKLQVVGNGKQCCLLEC